MSVNYDLQITTGGYYADQLANIISAVSSAIGVYPNYTYQRTEIIGDVVHIFYSDDSATSEGVQAEFLPAIPAIVYAILGVLAILGIAVIVWKLTEVATTAPTMIYAGLAVAGIFAVAYFINSTKSNEAY